MIKKILICFLLILNRSISSPIINNSINLNNLSINNTKLVNNDKVNSSLSDNLFEKNVEIINLKIDDEIKPKIIDEEKSFFDTEFLTFDKSNITEGETPTEQLKCVEKSTKRIDQLCERYHVNQANCSNLNFHLKKLPNWKCVLLKAKVNNRNVVLNQYEITCEHPSNNLEYYKSNSCSLIYNLIKNPDFSEMDDDYFNWKAFWIAIGSLVAFFLFICFCIPNKYCFPNCTTEKRSIFFVIVWAKLVLVVQLNYNFFLYTS